MKAHTVVRGGGGGLHGRYVTETHRNAYLCHRLTGDAPPPHRSSALHLTRNSPGRGGGRGIKLGWGRGGNRKPEKDNSHEKKTCSYTPIPEEKITTKDYEEKKEPVDTWHDTIYDLKQFSPHRQTSPHRANQIRYQIRSDQIDSRFIV